MYKVYLAGPITGTSYKDCTDWRQWFMEHLPDEIEGMSPLRGKDYLSGYDMIADHYNESTHRLQKVLSSQKGITFRDRNDCRTCDVLVANFLGSDRVSIGTVMEVAWADAYNKPIILVMEPENNLHDHAMIREVAGFRVETLEEAAFLCGVILLPMDHISDNSPI